MAQEQYIYELIDIEWSLNYDFAEPPLRVVRDVEDEEDAKPEEDTPIEYDENGIPMGYSSEEKEIRRKIIHEYIQNWRAAHADDPRIYNEEIGDYIKINQVFLLESVAHSAVRYLSTKAVLMFETIIAQAKGIGFSKVKQGTQNQKPFVRIMVLIFKSEDLGSVKITVGIRKQTEEKVGYSVTVPTPGTPFIEPGMRIAEKNGKKKAPHRK